MSAIGNVLWFFSFGLLLALQWWLAGLIMFCLVIGIPWAKACFVIGQLALFPFGKEAISRKDLKGADDIGTGALGMVGNVVWFFIGGVWLALGHCFAALVCAVTVIGIPFAIQHLKLAGLALAPIGKTVVSKEVAAAARATSAHAFVGQHRGRWPTQQSAQVYLAANPKRTAAGAGVGLLIFLVLAFIAIGAFSSKQEADRYAALTPEQRAAEDRQKAAEEKIATDRKAEADKKRAEQDKIVAAEKAARNSSSPAKVYETARVKEEATAKEVNRLTAENFSRIEDGMTYNQVKRIIGPATEETASSNIGAGTEFAVKTVMMTWKGSWGANCNVTFQNGVVMAKAQFGLPHGEPTSDLPDEEAEKAKEHAEADRNAAAQTAEREMRIATERRAIEAKRQAAIEKAKWHKWTTADGSHTIDAKFVKMVGAMVSLEKRNGTVIEVPKEKLSDDDIDWIAHRRWLE